MRNNLYQLLLLIILGAFLLFVPRAISQVAEAHEVGLVFEESRELSLREHVLVNYPELYDIIKCESGFNPDAKNPTSSASGLLQFIDSTYKWTYEEYYGSIPDMKNKNDANTQLVLGSYLYNEYGAHHWECHTKKMI